MSIQRPSPTTVIVPYPSPHLARRAARRLRADLPGTARVVFDADPMTDLAEAAAHAAASRAAVRGAAIGIALSLTGTAAVAASPWMATSLVLALGAAVALTGGPFAGGLGGFTVGLHRWSSCETAVVPWKDEPLSRPAFLAVRTLRPQLAASLLLGPADPRSQLLPPEAPAQRSGPVGATDVPGAPEGRPRLPV
jgi:hypothetical protein